MEKIGRHVAAKIRSIPEKLRSDQEIELLDGFEFKNKLSKERQQKVKEYAEKLFLDKPVEPLQKLSYDQLFFTLKHVFKGQSGKELSIEKERLDDYKTVICYLTNDERFFDCDNLSKETLPSFDKGILIVGGYGNGKSSVMRALSASMKYYRVRQFRFSTANKIVDQFESCQTAYEKKAFWKTFGNGNMCFDDVKTERDASNFGKYNLFKDLIERRYDNDAMTFITCNYNPAHPGSLNHALDEFGERYGARVYDRLFEMFNIIEFNGKSLRK
jgi:hypothetical protein